VARDSTTRTLRVEVVYALSDRQVLLELEVEEGATVREAIERSGLLARFPEIELKRGRVGIFGKTASLQAPLGAGDRVEIYRPLIADPKETRRERARRNPLKARGR
jgi:putative ubiquitin-RnfH superfamily antitoxin RatB of RatAB toxin-antitoxin module